MLQYKREKSLDRIREIYSQGPSNGWAWMPTAENPKVPLKSFEIGFKCLKKEIVAILIKDLTFNKYNLTLEFKYMEKNMLPYKREESLDWIWEIYSKVLPIAELECLPLKIPKDHSKVLEWDLNVWKS